MYTTVANMLAELICVTKVYESLSGFLTIYPYLVLTTVAVLLNYAIVFWSVYSFLSVIFVDNFTALLTDILSPSLLGIFWVLMITVYYECYCFLYAC